MKGYVKEIYKVYGEQDKNLIIPVYQRNYDWKIKQCGRLFDDLENLIREERPKHFFGAVVGKAEGSWKWIVIDGQQRLTTVSLLMLALSHSIDGGSIECGDRELAARIRKSYLVIDDGAKVKFKLKPVKDDDRAYKSLFRGEDHFVETSNVTANYRYLRKRVSESEFTADQLWDSICKLEVMYLDLESHDDPQRIFESLNSTGLALSESDKIRNFVLMGLENDLQERLYNDFWNRVEKEVDFRTDWFIRWYLVTKTGKTPNEHAVYEAFKTYAKESDASIEDILGDMLEYSRHCRAIIESATGYPQVDAALRRFNLIMGDVFLPFLMPVLGDVRAGVTDDADFLRVIEILESYLFRRITSSIAANALNKIFATAYGELRKLRRHEEKYADILTHLLLRRDGGGRFPRDDEFREGFQTRNMYNIRPMYRNYLFECLENGRSNDVRDIANALDQGTVSVEHVMPRTLSETWRRELGPDHEDVHATWINRIGNLTITGYNSTYYNAPFSRKLEMDNGFRKSPYRLNEYIRTQQHWGADQMAERTRILSDTALDYWWFPTTSFEPPAVVLPTEPLSRDTVFRGRAIVAFEFLDAKETVASWVEMITRLMRFIAEQYRSELIAIVDDFTNLELFESKEEPPERPWAVIAPGIRMFVNTSTSDKVRFLCDLFDALGFDFDDLVFTLRPVKSDSSEEEKTPDSVHSPILKFLPLIEEIEAQNVTPEDTKDLREEFRSAFSAFASDDAMADAKGLPLTAYSEEDTVASADTSQILAAITLTIAMTAAFDPLALHSRMVNGDLSRWLRRMEELETA